MSEGGLAYKADLRRCGHHFSHIAEDHISEINDARPDKRFDLELARDQIRRYYVSFEQSYVIFCQLDLFSDDSSDEYKQERELKVCRSLDWLQVYIRDVGDWDDLTRVFDIEFCQKISTLFRLIKTFPARKSLLSFVRALGRLPNAQYIHLLCDLKVHARIVQMFNEDSRLFTPAVLAIEPMLVDNLPQNLALIIRAFLERVLTWALRPVCDSRPAGVTDRFIALKFLLHYLKGTSHADLSEFESVIYVLHALFLEHGTLDIVTLSELCRCWQYLLTAYPELKPRLVDEDVIQALCQSFDADLETWPDPAEFQPLKRHPLHCLLTCFSLLFEENNPGLEYLSSTFPYLRLFDVCLCDAPIFQEEGFSLIQNMTGCCLCVTGSYLVGDAFWEVLNRGWEGAFGARMEIAKVMMNLIFAGDADLITCVVAQEIFPEILDGLTSFDTAVTRLLTKKFCAAITRIWALGENDQIRQLLINCGIVSVLMDLTECEDPETEDAARHLAILLELVSDL
jgi:hypothetical protein